MAYGGCNRRQLFEIGKCFSNKRPGRGVTRYYKAAAGGVLQPRR